MHSLCHVQFITHLCIIVYIIITKIWYTQREIDTRSNMDVDVTVIQGYLISIYCSFKWKLPFRRIQKKMLYNNIGNNNYVKAHTIDLRKPLYSPFRKKNRLTAINIKSTIQIHIIFTHFVYERILIYSRITYTERL